MEISMPFRVLLHWKNIFKKHKKLPKIKISKKGKGVKSILFFLPEKKEDAKIAHYLIKTDNPLPDYILALYAMKIQFHFIQIVLMQNFFLTRTRILIILE